MLTKKTKYSLASILTFCIGLATLLTLFISLVTIKYDNLLIAEANGFSMLVIQTEAFDSIFEPSSISFAKFLLSVQLIIAIATMLSTLISSLFYDKQKIYIGFNIACFVSTIPYLIMSILMTDTYKKYYMENNDVIDIIVENNTAAYVGIIITGVLLIAFFVFGFALKTKQENSLDKSKSTEMVQQNELAQNAVVELSDMKNTIEILKEYKTLFDSELINEQEFTSIKAKLLNKLN